MNLNSIHIQTLTYQPDTSLIFEAFAALPWAVWLDSGQRRDGTQNTRYDIISAFPQSVITMQTGNPFQTLKTILQSFSSHVECDYDLPFLGGAIGAFSYDLGRCLEVLPTIAKRDIDLPKMSVGIYAWAIIVDHQEQKTCLMINQEIADRQNNWAEVKLEMLRRLDTNVTIHETSFSQREKVPDRADEGKLKQLLLPLTRHFVPPSPVGRGNSLISSKPFHLKTPFKSNMSKAEYGEKYARVKHYLETGDCYQINLAQRFSATIEGSPWAAYKAIREKVPTPFAAFFNLDSQTILCHSPERFLLLKNGKVQTKPIKGTRPRSSDPIQDQALAEELQRSEKDRAENVMIVDLLRNDLGKVCEIGSVHVEKLCAVESFPNVHHLVSTIIGTLSNQHHALDLLQACFPGGSITGAPKYRAMQRIEELEPHRRAMYCGSIAYIDVRGNMDSNIAIRTLLWEKNSIHAYAGGGIVIDSDVDEEYQESLDKIQALLRALD